MAEIDELPLHRKWTLWFDALSYHKNYEHYTNPLYWKRNIKEIYTFNTVYDFIRLFNNLITPDKIWHKSSYHFFIYGVSPHYLDLNNLNGVSIRYVFNKDTNITDAWYYTLISIIGENCINSNIINGTSIVKYRNYFTIIIWLRIDVPKYVKNTAIYFYHMYKKYNFNIKDIKFFNFDTYKSMDDKSSINSDSSTSEC